MKCPSVSIIIPTRNRQRYANETVRTILSYNSPIEIIIQDNSDENTLSSLMADILDDERVVYHHIDNRIAGVDNYNLAAQYATGDFFCAIGDDDIVLPNILDCAAWMKRNHVDAVLPSKRLTYFWPNDNQKNAKNSFLGIGEFSCIMRELNPEAGVVALLKNGGQGYLSFPMIGSYHDLVRTDKMREVYRKTGRYYGGLSPDMYSAVCLSLLPDIRAVSIDYPMTLPGVCSVSTSAQADKGQHIGSLKDAPHFIGLLEPYQWDSMVPEIYTVQTIWCETMLHAIRKMGREELIDLYFNREELINRIYADNLEHKEFILEHIKEEDKKLIKYDAAAQVQRGMFAARIKYASNLLLGKRKRLYGCRSIGQAGVEIQKYLSKRNRKAKWDKIMASEQ